MLTHSVYLGSPPVFFNKKCFALFFFFSSFFFAVFFFFLLLLFKVFYFYFCMIRVCSSFYLSVLRLCFICFRSVSCIQCYLFLWTFHFWLTLLFSLIFIFMNDKKTHSDEYSFDRIQLSSIILIFIIFIFISWRS